MTEKMAANALAAGRMRIMFQLSGEGVANTIAFGFGWKKKKRPNLGIRMGVLPACCWEKASARRVWYTMIRRGSRAVGMAG